MVRLFSIAVVLLCDLILNNDIILCTSTDEPVLFSTPAKLPAYLPYSNLQLLESQSALDEFIVSPRLTMIYFKPEVKLTFKRKSAERQFFEAVDGVAEYLRTKYGVIVGIMNCADMEDAESKGEMCDASENEDEEEVAWFYEGGSPLIALEITTLFSEDAVVANILSVSSVWGSLLLNGPGRERER